MNISVLDRANGVYGLQQPDLTAQDTSFSSVPAFPVYSPLSPPNGYESWDAFYEAGNK